MYCNELCVKSTFGFSILAIIEPEKDAYTENCRWKAVFELKSGRGTSVSTHTFQGRVGVEQHIIHQNVWKG